MIGAIMLRSKRNFPFMPTRSSTGKAGPMAGLIQQRIVAYVVYRPESSRPGNTAPTYSPPTDACATTA